MTHLPEKTKTAVRRRMTLMEQRITRQENEIKRLRARNDKLTADIESLRLRHEPSIKRKTNDEYLEELLRSVW